MHTVWISYKFREELPQEENKTFRILSDNYNRVHQIDLNDSKVLKEEVPKGRRKYSGYFKILYREARRMERRTTHSRAKGAPEENGC